MLFYCENCRSATPALQGSPDYTPARQKDFLRNALKVRFFSSRGITPGDHPVPDPSPDGSRTVIAVCKVCSDRRAADPSH